MSGDTLITALVQAPDAQAALAIASSAPIAAVREAADLLYVEADGHAGRTIRRYVAEQARA
jgi:hypothetical protein